jgi:hypothetical protein
VIAQSSRVDVIAPIGNQKGQRGKPIYDLAAVLRPRKALQQFL